jgi:hypothetical protein
MSRVSGVTSARRYLLRILSATRGRTNNGKKVSLPPSAVALCLGLAHDFPHGFLFRFLVEKGDRRAQGDHLSQQLRCIDHFGARELIRQLGYASLIEGL